MAITCGIIAGVLVLVLLFKPFFGDVGGFWECIRFWLTPDVVSMFRGEWEEDWWSEMKLGLWLVCGGAAGFGVYTGVTKLFS